jgi:predicted nucleic acid-binding protein
LLPGKRNLLFAAAPRPRRDSRLPGRGRGNRRGELSAYFQSLEEPGIDKQVNESYTGTMAKMRIYLDNCAYNRPFDDKSRLTIRMEAAAKLQIQEAIRNGVYELVWSYMNEYENNENPYDDKREAVGAWKYIAVHRCLPGARILARGMGIQRHAIKPKDSLNLACAIESECRYFITTDGALLKKAGLFSEIEIINPIDFVRKTEETDGSDNQI